MIIHDYECKDCRKTTEHYIYDSGYIPDMLPCPDCCGMSKRIVSLSQTAPVDAGWISSVIEVVDKNSDKPHCTEFIKHPTRQNYKRWMAGEGLRPIEPGEKSTPNIDTKKKKDEMRRALLKKHFERNAVEVKS